MKSYFTLILFCLLALGVVAQPNWQLVNGIGYHPATPLRGTLNHEHPFNSPGFRKPIATWTYQGEFYMYGGQGFRDLEGGGSGASNISYNYNNIWKYNPASNNWTWIKPGTTSEDVVNYGTVGVESAEARPKPGTGGSGWLVGDYFYLYDGSFWRFNMLTKNWMCIKMVPNAVYSPSYGQMNVPSTTAYPAPRVAACTWVKDNFLYLYGGGTANGNDAQNDLWKYNLNTGEWTWIKGGPGNNDEVLGITGIEDAQNRPGNNNPVLLGIYGDHVFIYNSSDQVWRYNMSTNNWCIKFGKDYWTMASPPVPYYYDNPRYGMQNVYHPTNSPGRRWGSIGWTNNGRLYIFGGTKSYNNSATYWDFDHNEVWEFDTAISQWCYIKGNAAVNQYGKYGVQGVESPGNLPGGRTVMMHWKSGDNVFMIGGMGLGPNGKRGVQTDVWKYNHGSNNFTWLKGKPNATLTHVAMALGQEHKFNMPGLANDYAHWQSDSFMYVYGVAGRVADSLPKAGTKVSVWYEHTFVSRSFDALWRYNKYTNKWALFKEQSLGYMLSDPDDIDRAAVYGPLNTYSDSATPGRRDGVATWMSGHKLYLFGGVKTTTDQWSMVDSFKNDLWEFNPVNRQWRWIKGPNLNNTAGIYGQQGVFAAQNVPGARSNPLTWTYNGKFYLMGGRGYNESGQLGLLNDLWEYDPQIGQWRWLHGNKLLNQPGVPGTIGMGTATTRPGARRSAPCWVLNGKLYTFSGRGRSTGANSDNSLLNELWVYDIATNIWTLLRGYMNPNEYDGYTYAAYGTKGVESPNNRPGAIADAGATVLNGRLILFGGYGHGQCGSCGGNKNNIWSYNPATNNWTFIEGAADSGAPLNFPDGPYNFTPPPVPTPSHGVYLPEAWIFQDKLYMMGGTPESASSFRNIWRFDLCQLMPGICGPTQPPVVFLGADTSICTGNVFTLDAGNVGAKYLWNTNDTTQEVAVTQSGQYWVRVTDPATNLVATDTINIQLLTPPAVPFAGVVSLCAGDTLVLDAQNSGAVYQWSNGSTTQQISVNAGGVYTAEIRNSSNCMIQAAITVNYLPKPVFSLGNDTGFCASWGGQMNLRPLAPEPPYISHQYHWSDGSTNYGLDVNQGGIYHLVITNAYGCSFSDTVQVTADTVIDFSLGADTLICPNDSIILGAFHPGYSYNWSNGSQDALITVNQPGIYECSMLSPNGCNQVSGIYVGHLPTQQPTATGTQIAINGKTVSFSYLGLSHVDSFYWDFGDGSTSTDNAPSHTYSQYGVYPAKLHIKNQCLQDSIDLLVELVDPTTGISQNLLQAGITVYPNPAFNTIFIESKQQPVTAISIMNAIGQKVILKEHINLKEVTEDIAHLTDGMYFIVIETQQQQHFYGRFVKQSR